MKNAAKQYSFTKKDTVSIKYFSCSKGAEDGSLNGLDDLKNMDLKVSGIRAVPQKESGEKLLSIWLRRYSPSERSWSLTEPDVLLSLALELRLSIGNSNRGDLKISHLSLLLPESSLIMEKPRKLRPKEITAIINLILLSGQRRWETSIRQTLLAHDISEVQKGLPDSIPFTLWMWQAIQPSQVSSLINRLSLCANILLKHGNISGFLKVSQVDNEMSATGGGRYPYSISQFIRLHLLMGIHLVFIPQGEPGRNASVESFNALWQERVLRRHNCPTLTALKRTGERFLQYYHYEKPHRGLTQKEYDTRFPGILRDRLWKSLRHLPKRFNLDKYRDSNGHLNLPIAKGKVSSIRKVDSHGKIEVNGTTYFIKRKLEGQYVIATIFTHRKRLVVKQENKIIKSFSFPIKGHIINPLLPDARSKT